MAPIERAARADRLQGELAPIERGARADRLQVVARPGEVVPEEWAAGQPALVGWAVSDVVAVSDRLQRQVEALAVVRVRGRRVAREPVERAVVSGARRWAPGGRVLLV